MEALEAEVAKGQQEQQVGVIVESTPATSPVGVLTVCCLTA
jgi:hypothetical protein